MNQAEFTSVVSTIASVKPIEVRDGYKGFCLRVEIVTSGDQTIPCYYYPEQGVVLIDERVPKPWELRHMVAFSILAAKLDIPGVVPAALYTLDAVSGDAGVLVPALSNVLPKQIYHFENNNLLPTEQLVSLAALDYLAGVTDRTSNDVLFYKDGSLAAIVDSGVSFVTGTEFVAQHAVLRRAMKNQLLPQQLMEKLNNINSSDLSEFLLLLYQAEVAIDWILRRRDCLVTAGQVL